MQALAQRRRPADQKGFDILHSTAAATESRRDECRQAAVAAEMQVIPLLRTVLILLISVRCLLALLCSACLKL